MIFLFLENWAWPGRLAWPGVGWGWAGATRKLLKCGVVFVGSALFVTFFDQFFSNIYMVWWFHFCQNQMRNAIDVASHPGLGHHTT